MYLFPHVVVSVINQAEENSGNEQLSKSEKLYNTVLPQPGNTQYVGIFPGLCTSLSEPSLDIYKIVYLDLFFLMPMSPGHTERLRQRQREH